MFLLALIAVLATSFFGWVILGVSAIMLIWMVARIHQEFSGGSGTKKVWPTIWFLLVPLLYIALAWHRPDTFDAFGKPVASFMDSVWANLTVWHALSLAGYYVLIGLGYSLFEMRVTLWRDKKKVVTQFTSYLSSNIQQDLLAYLERKFGSSAAGPEDPLKSAVSLVASNAIDGIRQEIKAETTKFRTWAHMIPSYLTLGAAFVRNANPKQLLEQAEQDFKDDVVKFEAGLKDFLATYNHNSFNPHTAYLELSVNSDGTLDPAIKKADLAICLANWTFWWPGYGLNFVFGDMFEAIFTRLSAWISKVYGSYVKKYFADITAIKV